MGSRLLLALLVFEVRLTSVSGYLQLEGVVGENVSISAKVPSDFNVTGVIWRHLSSTEKLVAMFFKGDAETTYQSRFFGRARLLPNFTLEIDNLELGDSGTFKALLMDSTGRIETNIVVLMVYGAEGSIHENKYFLCIVLPLLFVLVSAIMFWIARFLKCTGKKKKKGDDAGGEAEELAV